MPVRRWRRLNEGDKGSGSFNYGKCERLVEIGVRCAKPKIVDYYRHFGRFPADNEAAGVPSPKLIIGHYVGAVSVEGGVINVRFRDSGINAGLQGQVLSLRPLVVNGSLLSPIAWACGDAAAPSGMAAVGKNRTTLKPIFLPSNCRRP